ncbi:MAG: ferritin-like domain-containing protein [Acidimicrobiia bacterium]|nr:ferritin-like domain-containing protein [Acidimicrobiia bacterium]
MNIDERAMKSLVEESQDLQSVALRDARASHKELQDIGASRAGQAPDLDRIREYAVGRRKVLKAGGFGLGVLASSGLLSTAWGSRVSAIVNRPVSYQAEVDIQIFQTACSLENLAIATYEAALGLPFVTDNAVVKTFAETTMMQHAEHCAAFQSQTESLGGQRQEGTNPKYTPIVEDAKAGLTDVLAVIKLAATLEEVAGDTYHANLSLLSDGNMRLLMGSVQGVEMQHLATLRAVGALIEGGAPELVAIPTDLAALPAAAGSASFPEPFEEPNLASPPEEGAVK